MMKEFLILKEPACYNIERSKRSTLCSNCKLGYYKLTTINSKSDFGAYLCLIYKCHQFALLTINILHFTILMSGSRFPLNCCKFVLVHCQHDSSCCWWIYDCILAKYTGEEYYGQWLSGFKWLPHWLNWMFLTNYESTYYL